MAWHLQLFSKEGFVSIFERAVVNREAETERKTLVLDSRTKGCREHTCVVVDSRTKDFRERYACVVLDSNF